MDSEIITLDTETRDNSDYTTRKLLGLGLTCPIKGRENYLSSFYLPFRHEHTFSIVRPPTTNVPIEWLAELGDTVFANRTKWFVAHNMPADDDILEREGIEMAGKKFCTLILAWLNNENEYNYSLEALAHVVGERKLKDETKIFVQGFGGWEKVPPEGLAKYCMKDAVIAWKLFKYYMEKLRTQEYDFIIEQEMRFNNLIKKMIQRGIQIDLEVAQNLSDLTKQQMQERLNDLGYDPGKPTELANRLFLPPPRGLGLTPLPDPKTNRTYSVNGRSKDFPMGRPLMNKSILTKLEATYLNEYIGKEDSELNKILEYRSWVKANSTWYEGWLNKADKNGRIHPGFKQHGTKTSRLSCEEPNMHQVPRDIDKTPVKKMLRASTNYELWSLDYNQIEFRLACLYAEVPELLDLLMTGGDVHALTGENVGAYEMFPEHPDKARYVGKQTNYLTIYGGGAAVLVMQLWRDARIAINEERAASILKAFHASYPGFRKASKRAEAAVATNKYIKYWNGFRRRIPYRDDFHKAFNSCVQGGAAQILRESMFRLDDAGFIIVNQVHDDIWLEIPAGKHELLDEAQTIMEWATEDFGLPFTVERKCLYAPIKETV